ncbi:MAG: tetratricopeptide repeat protein [Blautia sp.]|nr:tetratricopeptide repeat protein [Blautia sp.]
MKLFSRKTAAAAMLCMAVLFSAGCGENQEVYEQAGKDLEQGSYEYARSGYEQSAADGIRVMESWRGAGIASLRLGEYEKAAEEFTNALSQEKVPDSFRKDILSYRAVAWMKDGNLENAMLDCQTLAEEFDKDADISFLTGTVALGMDAYDEADREFRAAYEKDPSYEMAIRIYQEYLKRDMEADGTSYLESALDNEPKTAQDYCDRGRVYYYMEDYDKAAQELIEAQSLDEKDADAYLLLGMVYLARHDISNARAMYQQYISLDGSSARGYNGLALCDMEEGDYFAALTDIGSGIKEASTEEMQILLFNEIVVYEKMLDFATARDKAEEYAAMFPDDEEAVKELGFLKSRTGMTGISE